MGMSMNDKIIQAFDLSIPLADAYNAGQLHIEEHDVDFIFGHADGLVAKHLYNLRDGCCSLQASIDFDIGEAEKQLDVEIKHLKKLEYRRVK